MEDLLTTPIRATDPDALNIISGLLHDEYFDLDGVRFDRDAEAAEIPVRRQFHSGPERLIKKGLVFNIYEKEWMRSLVTIRTVRSWEALKDQGIGSYSFCTWHFSEGIIEVKCNEALVLKFHVDDLDVNVANVGFQGKARIKRGPWGMDSFTGRIHE